jgi:hypothetical protein
MNPMKKPVFALLALLSLMAFAPVMAQTPPVTEAPAPDTEFLATLSDGQAQISGDQMPAPFFTSGCTDNSQCPTGQICCFMCGALPDGDPSGCRMCVTPERGRCPIVA